MGGFSIDFSFFPFDYDKLHKKKVASLSLCVPLILYNILYMLCVLVLLNGKCGPYLPVIFYFDLFVDLFVFYYGDVLIALRLL